MERAVWQEEGRGRVALGLTVSHLRQMDHDLRRSSTIDPNLPLGDLLHRICTVQIRSRKRVPYIMQMFRVLPVRMSYYGRP